MDLNRLFLFVVVVSTLLVLARSVRRPPALPWISALVVLVITGIAFLFARRVSGWIGITAWIAILFLPAMISGWRHRTLARPQLSLTPVVTILIMANAAMFLVELALGGSMNPETLNRLGELDAAAVWFGHEYWRLFTALFLHYGALHLAFNLYALWIIGPGLERAIGGWRFIVCYLVAGVGSSAGVVLLRAIRLTTAEQLVGASGCVMGIVGAWAGLLLRRRDFPMAGKRLQNIALIVAIQTAFDLSTPQVSLAAHLSGLVVGFVVGFLVAPRPNLADTLYAR
jgi:membrane associated rhomboid family serine protease